MQAMIVCSRRGEQQRGVITRMYIVWHMHKGGHRDSEIRWCFGCGYHRSLGETWKSVEIGTDIVMHQIIVFGRGSRFSMEVAVIVCRCHGVDMRVARIIDAESIPKHVHSFQRCHRQLCLLVCGELDHGMVCL